MHGLLAISQLVEYITYSGYIEMLLYEVKYFLIAVKCHFRMVLYLKRIFFLQPYDPFIQFSYIAYRGGVWYISGLASHTVI